MRGQLLILTFGLAVLFHGATSSRSEKLSLETTTATIPATRRVHQPPPLPLDGLTKNKIREIAQSMGVANYEEFSASVGSSEEAPGMSSGSNEYFSIRRQRATSLRNREDFGDNAGSGSAEYQTYQGVMGKPGRDFPVLTHIPKTKFSCRRAKSGYYADLDTDCQVFHICDNGRKISFLCPNGTIFRQSDLICDWWFKVDCGSSPSLYESSAEHLALEEQRRKEERKVMVEKRVLTDNFKDSGELVSYEASTYVKPNYQMIKNQVGFQQPIVVAQVDRKGKGQEEKVQYHTESPTAVRYTNAHHQFTKSGQFTRVNRLFTTTPSMQEYTTTTTPLPSTTTPFIVQAQTQTQIQKSGRKFTSQYSSELYDEARNTRSEGESQLPAESASFTSNSNKQYYQKPNQNIPISNQVDFTRNNIFNPANFAQTANIVNNPRLKNFKTVQRSRRPINRHKVENKTVETSNKTEDTFKNFNFSTYTQEEFRFNESFAPYTTLRPIEPKTTTTNAPVTGHFITYTFPTTQLPTETSESNRQSKLVSSSSIQNPINVTKYNKKYESTTYEPPIIDSLYSKVTKSYLDVQTTEITPELLRHVKNYDPTTTSTTTETSYFYPVPTNFSDPTIYSPEDLSYGYTTTERLKYSQSATKYSPTVPTITPRPNTEQTTQRSSINSITDPTPKQAEEHAIEMLHTLEDLSGKKSDQDIVEKVYGEPRPGLRVPPSSSPDTLHSLAVYFASTSEDKASREAKKYQNEIEGINNILTKSTLDQYNELFYPSKGNLNETVLTNEIKNRINNELHETDLDIEQSQGIVSSSNKANGTNIRKLARVFTNALSEYLKDPETFRRVLTEIRPTEPPQVVFEPRFAPSVLTTTSEPSTTVFTDHPSITKEEGEVLDFSDVVKTTPRGGRYTTTPYPDEENSEYPSTTENLIIQLNREFENPGYTSVESSSADDFHEDYFPTNFGDKIKTTPVPYGADVKPENSTPIFSEAYTESSTPPPLSGELSPPKHESSINKVSSDLITYFVPEDLNNLAVIRVNEDLPSRDNFQSDSLKKITEQQDEEKLQIASSQSFVGNGNYIDGKSLKSPPKPEFRIIVTTEYPETTTRVGTTEYGQISTTPGFTTSTPPSTEYPGETTTRIEESTTSVNFDKVPGNHWSKSYEISQLLKATVTLDPETINHELIGSTRSATTERISTTYSNEITTENPSTTDMIKQLEETIHLAESSNGFENRQGKIFEKPISTHQLVIDFPEELEKASPEVQMKSAKMIFGGLNTTSQDIIMEKMKHADTNKSVRKLVLLLINTCDLNHNRTLEHARKAILNALINVPLDEEEEKPSSVKPTEEASTVRISFRNFEETTILPTTTDFVSTTTDFETTTTTQPSFSNDLDRAETRFGKHLDPNSIQQPHLELLPPNDRDSDTRALELLKSLYGLASRWGRK